jgi:predicted lipoprotein with Yx(FWY)xxD motif
VRISELLRAVVGIALVVGVWGGLGVQAQGGMYTVSLHALKSSYNDPVALTNSNGMTLYYNAMDTGTRSTCTGDCAKIWPPLLSDGKPTKDPKVVAGSKIDGEVGVVKTANGSQVTYNGHLLYSYTGDAAPGEATGSGKGGKWYVVTPVLPKW